MDFSTISNKTGCTEIEDLTNGEITEQYYVLKKQYQSLLISFEATKQELYDTKRSYQTALDVQGHLNAELESYQSDEIKRRNELQSRIQTLQEDLSELRQEQSETAERHASEIQKYEGELKRLQEEQILPHENQIISAKDSTELEEARAAVTAALNEAEATKMALEEAQSEIMQWRLKTEELVTEVGEMRAAADLRREELKVAAEREASVMADLVEARAMLQQCTDTQDIQPHAAKGNSIFAEVEDKRQEMAKTLLQMKQTNSRLRRELANKQAELDTLLHEKQTIWEQQVGASAHYDRELIESYEERITQLEGLCERQRRETARWGGKMSEPVQHWLPAVLEHFKSECEQLRGEVLSRGAAQLAAAAQLRELRRRLAALTHKTNNNNDTNNKTNNNTDDTKPASNTRTAHTKLVPIKPKQIDDVKKKVSFN